MTDDEIFEAERPRLTGLATRMLGDRAGAEDVVQQAWLRLHGNETTIENLPAWLTTVTSRLCLDRLRATSLAPLDEIEVADAALSPEEEVALASAVGTALHVVLDRLTPTERVAFVLHDSFAFDFGTISAVLGTTPAAARKLASRARAKVNQPSREDALADWEVVDAFLEAARGGDFARLLELLAPQATIAGDPAAVAAGTPTLIEGRDAVATFFNGAAKSALPALLDGKPGAAWYLKGEAKVVFDFTVTEGRVARIDFRAEPGVLARVIRRPLT